MAASRPTRAFSSFVCQSCRQRLLPHPTRTFSTTPTHNAPPPNNDSALAGLGALSTSINSTNRRKGFNNSTTNNSSTSYLELLDAAPDDPSTLLSDQASRNLNPALHQKPHRLHVLATKHNTHITLVQPPRPAAATASSAISGTSASAADQKKIVDVLLSLSTGNLNFRKAGRGSYDAAYQLASFVLKQIQEKGMQRDISKLEVVLRGFGAGREAVTKVLLGSEGRYVRGKICAVVDATRLKLGGPRSKKPRRLG